jgi:hypothetical protein
MSCKVVVLSGTVMKRSVRDFSHLLRWALKDGAPVPRTEHEIAEWADCLDERVCELDRRDPGALALLCPDVADATLEDVRRGFRDRLLQTEGVVAVVGGGEDCNASLYLRALPFKVKPITDQHFEKLRRTAMTPDDWPLSQAVDIYRHSLELALGFHQIWVPRPPQDWRDARREWFCFVRETLSRSRTLDSPLEVANAVRGGRINDNGLLEAWKKIEPSYIIKTAPIWHDDSALKTCMKWMAEEPGLVWTEHKEFAFKLSELSGAPYYGARGLTPAGKFIDDADPKSSAIASIDANREGRNLQSKWSRMLFTSPPASSDIWQQSIGRLHRSGQEADEVQVDILMGCGEHHRAVLRAIQNAESVRDTTGAASKLLEAEVDWPDEDEVALFSGARWR